MHPENALGVPRLGGDLANRNRRRVGGQHRGRKHRVLQFAEHRALDRQVFEHGFDHQLGAGKAGEVGGAAEVCLLPLELEPRHPAALELPAEDVDRHLEAATDAGEIGILEPCLQPGRQHSGAGDARPHEARTDDPEPPHRARPRGTGRHPIVLLQRGGGEEDLDQPARNVGHGQFAERLGLGLESLRHPA